MVAYGLWQEFVNNIFSILELYRFELPVSLENVSYFYWITICKLATFVLSEIQRKKLVSFFSLRYPDAMTKVQHST